MPAPKPQSLDLHELLSILEFLAAREPLTLSRLSAGCGVPAASVRRGLDDLRRLGVEVAFDPRYEGYRILDWGPILHREGVTSGYWRQVLLGRPGDAGSEDSPTAD